MSFTIPQTDAGLTNVISGLLETAGFTVLAKQSEGSLCHFTLFFKTAEEVLYKVEVNQGDFTTIVALTLDGNDGNGLTIQRAPNTSISISVTMDGDVVVFSSPQASSTNLTCRCEPEGVPEVGTSDLLVQCYPNQVVRTVIITKLE